jgi:hypothetical protein
MATGILLNSPHSNQTANRPLVSTYDSGYEHGFDHYVDVKVMLQAADPEANDSPATLALAS